MRKRHSYLFLPPLAVFCLFSFVAAEEPWQQWDWGAASSVQTLYHPAWRIEVQENKVRFLAHQFTYTYESRTDHWVVTAEENEWEQRRTWEQEPGKPVRYIQRMLTTRGSLEAETQGSDREQGQLELRWSGSSQPFARLRLWTREQLGQIWFEREQRQHPPPASPETLAEKICMSWAEVADWDEDEQKIWLAIRFYEGEGCAGIGTILEIDKDSNDVRVHQPAPLNLVSIAHILAIESELWLATERFGEGGTGPGIGLVRYNPRTGNLQSVPKMTSQIMDMAHGDGLLWVATEEGVAACDLENETWRKWRFIPRVAVAELVPVANRPGSEPRGQLPAGDYEVRWVGEGFLELLTPDCAEGYVDSSSLERLAKRGFCTSPSLLASSPKWGNPPSLLVFSSPRTDPKEQKPSAWFLRVPAVPKGKENGSWQAVEVCAGWVELQPDRVYISIEEEATGEGSNHT
ncbi:hypothetical protein MYX77_00590 [Acidobacteriia bacterium AH_259_A11_L15]|nr:hypothetical protein [Acidobacteriia bacterium AH_259_A11_L15]